MSEIMIDTLQSEGIAACAKHFPGHGDTNIDSHLSLPVLNKSLHDLEFTELYPFRKAVEKGVKTMMLGHIACHALDDTGIPASVSHKTIEYIRNKLGYDGLILTDAMNMGGLSLIGQHEAGAMALRANVDILLHPSNPHELNAHLKRENAPLNLQRVEAFRKTLVGGIEEVPDFEKNRSLSAMVAEQAVKPVGDVSTISPSSVVIIKENEELVSGIFEEYLRDRYPGVNVFAIEGEAFPDSRKMGNEVLTVIYSTTGAWKGGTPDRIRRALDAVEKKTALFTVFGNPYVVHGINRPKLFTYWCSELAERAVVKWMEH